MFSRFGNVVFDQTRHTLHRVGEPAQSGIVLQAKVESVLVVLVKAEGRVVSKESLLDAVWPGVATGPNSLTRAISKLRKVLSQLDADGPDIIQTVIGRGYCIATAITHQSDASQSPSADDRVRLLAISLGEQESDGPTPAARIPQSLPPPPADFQGRTLEREEVAYRLRAGASIIGIQGLGGVGKTALALRTARDLSADFPDGLAYVNLRGASEKPLSADRAMRIVIRGLRPELDSEDDELPAVYQSLVAERRILLVLDDASGARQVEPLLLAPPAAILLTSRSRIVLPGLVSVGLQQMTSDDSEAFLRAMVAHVGGAAAGISDLCGHLPLALRAAGSALAERPDWDPERYRQRLSDSTQRLHQLNPVEASFSVSFDQLDAPTQARLAILSLFPDVFDQYTASALWDTSIEDADRTLGIVIRYGLIESTRSPDEDSQYRLHDLMRLFLRDRLPEALAGGSIQGLMPQGRWGFWGIAYKHLRTPRRAAEFFEMMLDITRQLGDRRGEGGAVGNLGLAYSLLEQPERAVECHLQSLEIARELGERRGECHTLFYLSYAYRLLAQPEKSLDVADRGLEIAREIGHRTFEAYLLDSQSRAHGMIGNEDEALETGQQAAAISRQLADAPEEARHSPVSDPSIFGGGGLEPPNEQTS